MAVPPAAALVAPRPVTSAIGYLRVSTAEQAGSGLGLEAQLAAIDAACSARGWELAEVFSDAGVSSTAVVRPGLEAAVAACAARKGSVLVVAKVDRLARSLSTYAALVDRARREGWALYPLDSPDGTTPQGEAMQAMVAVFAQLERRLIGQRTREALAAARARGVQLGRPVECPPEVVDQILALRRRRRMSARAIARWLEAEEVPAPRGGTAWSDVTVGGVLKRAGITLRKGRPPSRKRAAVSCAGAAPSRPAN